MSKKGLTSQQAKELLKTHGPNEIPQQPLFVFLKSFLSQFKNFLVLLLTAAALVSLFLGEIIDSFFILLIVVLNALFGLYQEYKAEKSLQALKQMTITTVRVVRDETEQEIDNRFLVPGDLIYLEQGAKIPADAKLLKSNHLEVNEAPLTGESLPVGKDPADNHNDSIFLGTVITKGRCWAQVTHTGASTRFGQIAASLSHIEKGKTPLQAKLESLTRHIGIMGILASLSVFILSFTGGKSPVESFIFAVSLAVASVPEGLPAVMTITLSIGVERMAGKKAIVRKLNAIEALGSITLLATDKTGTLTTNKMQVKRVWIEGKDYSTDHLPPLTNPAFAKLVLNGILCSTASVVFKVDHGSFDVLGDATEGAMLLLGHRLGWLPQDIKSEWKIVEEQPFDSTTKRMSVTVNKGQQTLVLTKGAPESIMAICDQILIGASPIPLTQTHRSNIETQFRNYARKGLRLLAFSYLDQPTGHSETKQTFLGFVGIADPARAGAAEAVRKARLAGIKVVMITGDSELTAEAIGIETGIVATGQDILTGSQLDQFSDADLLKVLPNVQIFARTTPEHKLRLVKLFQNLGEIVAVTGDGVNDALALKQAEVGIAMGLTGTDVAKEVADMVITDDNFISLVNAIEEGRSIFNHIKNAVKFLLACNVGEVLYILTAVIFRLPLLSPLQILYMNLVTDGLPAISFAFSPHDSDVMAKQPKMDQVVLNASALTYVILTGVLTALAGLISATMQHPTVLFTTIILVQHIVLIDTWLSHQPLLKNIHQLKNLVFLAAFFLPLAFHPVLLYSAVLNDIFSTTPLTLGQLLFSISIPVGMLLTLEIFKTQRHRAQPRPSLL